LGGDRIVGERFWIYASKKKLPVASDQLPGKAWSNDLAVAGDATPGLLLELWEMLRRGDLTTGVIVGSAVIEKVEEVAGCQLPVGNPATVIYWQLVTHN
jgi:hypothetical protein